MPGEQVGDLVVDAGIFHDEVGIVFDVYHTTGDVLKVVGSPATDYRPFGVCKVR